MSNQPEPHPLVQLQLSKDALEAAAVMTRDALASLLGTLGRAGALVEGKLNESLCHQAADLLFDRWACLHQQIEGALEEHRLPIRLYVPPPAEPTREKQQPPPGAAPPYASMVAFKWPEMGFMVALPAAMSWVVSRTYSLDRMYAAVRIAARDAIQQYIDECIRETSELTGDPYEIFWRLRAGIVNWTPKVSWKTEGSRP